MRFLVGLFLLCWVSVAAAYHPLPVTKSAAEAALNEALAKADTDSARVHLAREALDTHPDDIPLGRAAQDILLKLMDDPAGYFKARAESSQSAAARYLYARASNDTTVMERESKWMLERNPRDFWGLFLSASAEWDKAKPDTAIVYGRFRAAIDADPSRPEAYLNLGYFFQDEERWLEAREVLDAGAVADPANKAIRDARLTTFAELRDADTFFKLMEGINSDKPLEADLPRANGPGRFTTADLRGQPTVLEYWAYT
jgi:hypothetical protein